MLHKIITAAIEEVLNKKQVCPHCKTIFTIPTEDIDKVETQCPFCFKKISWRKENE